MHNFRKGDRVLFMPRNVRQYDYYDRHRIGRVAYVLDESDIPTIRFARADNKQAQISAAYQEDLVLA